MDSASPVLPEHAVPASATAPAAEAPPPEATRPRAHLPARNWGRALAVVAVGTFMSTLDSSIVNVSLRTIQGSLRCTFTSVEWVVLAYLGTLSILLLPFGRISDLLGRRNPFAAGFALFTFGSLACGMASTIGGLIGGRVLQAVGAALLMANGPAIITESSGPQNRGKALGIIGSIVGLGIMVGPPLGGWLVAHAPGGWRSIFFVNLPIGVAGTVAALLVLPRRGQLSGRGAVFDGVGTLLGAVAIGGGLFGLLGGPERGWGRIDVWGPLAAAAAAGVAFVLWESRHPDPLVSPGIFRCRRFSAAVASTVISYVAIFASIFLLPYFLGTVRGQTPPQYGRVLAALPLVMALVTPLAGARSDRAGSRGQCALGLLLAVGSVLWLANLSGPEGTWDAVLGMAGMGLGMGLFQPANSSAVLGAAAPEDLGVVAGILALTRNLGMILGYVLAGSIFASVLGPSGVVAFIPEPGAAARPAPGEFMAAYRAALLAAAGVTALGVFTSWRAGRPEAPPPSPCDTPEGISPCDACGKSSSCS